ncbi:branched-chain amino acid ABC transporter permease [Enterocloster sp. OA13]|uniref:branched-chain amino acid ABC transporter permease n=1 Tax=Enterocloster sp. OA13 TaxID=2914161 RepID=UPI00047164A7|nr:branched-chain amino acid ABC transporter permease [Enterocloster sp. OA13]
MNKCKFDPKTGAMIIFLIIFSLIVSLKMNNYTVLVVNMALINMITAYGLSIMLGMCGQLVFSGVAFMGIGAYITANLCSGRMNFILPGYAAIIVSVVLTALIAWATGILFLRLKSSFCTFATLGFVQVLYTLFLNYEPAFGGPKGIPEIRTLSAGGFVFDSYKKWYFLLLGAVIIVALLVERIRRTSLGRSLASIRDNELAAQTLGVNIYRTRVIAFVIAGAFAGLSGTLLAQHNRFISGDQFSFAKSTTIVIMSMLGGINSTPGIFVGALIVTFLPEVLRGLDKYLMFIYGIAVIIMMIFMPMGIGGAVSDFLKTMRRKNKLKS